MSDQPPQSVVVPVEPTPEMTMAGAGCLPSVDGVFGLAGALSANVWSSMLAAAPAPSSLAGGEVTNDQIQSVMLAAIKEVRATVTDATEGACMDADIIRMERGLVDMGDTGWAVMRSVHRRLAALSPEAPARDEVVMAASDAPMWADGIVTDGENVAMAQKAETDHGGHYWAVNGGDGGLDWEPTHFISLDALTPRHEAPGDPCDRHKAEGFSIDPCCPHCEAPAEGAGEAARIIACHLPIPEAPDTVYLPITMTAGDLRAIYAALRARSSAPEARDAAD